MKEKYGFIADNFSTLDQVITALRGAGLESSNLIIGVDFTKSNEWTGQVSFDNRSLHAICGVPNPYEKAISIIGKTLAPFDEDNLIPCFGFGDCGLTTLTTGDKSVFSFHSDHTPCQGFDEVLSCYRKILPKLQLSGPTSYAPIIEAAIHKVEQSGGQFHVLVIVADGQVTRSFDTDDKELSTQEKQTINAIISASSYPLSIILVGVGDGPWEEMHKFDDRIPKRKFDNFQFVNFTAIVAKNVTESKKEADFALGALMEVPTQYKAIIELGLLGRTKGKTKKLVPLPPPVSNVRNALPSSQLPTPTINDQSQECPVCWTKRKDLAFGCGHMTCRECGLRLSNCPICRMRISSRLRVYTG